MLRCKPELSKGKDKRRMVLEFASSFQYINSNALDSASCQRLHASCIHQIFTSFLANHPRDVPWQLVLYYMIQSMSMQTLFIKHNTSNTKRNLKMDTTEILPCL